MNRENSSKVAIAMEHLTLESTQFSPRDNLGLRRWILGYHELYPAPSRYRYGVTVSQFREHLSLFLRLGLASQQAARPEITFDDGHYSNFELALPLLEESGLWSTFFVLAGCVGADQRYMTWSHLRQIVTFGHRVQSHGWSHRLLVHCSDRELVRELLGSRQMLEDKLGTEVSALSVPGGRWDERIIRAAYGAGYQSIYHSNPWLPLRMSQGMKVRGRLMVTGRMDAGTLRRQIHMNDLRWKYHRAIYQAKETVRIVLGDSFYHRIWSRLANFNSEDGLDVQIRAGNTEKEPRKHENPAAD